MFSFLKSTKPYKKIKSIKTSSKPCIAIKDNHLVLAFGDDKKHGIQMFTYHNSKLVPKTDLLEFNGKFKFPEQIFWKGDYIICVCYKNIYILKNKKLSFKLEEKNFPKFNEIRSIKHADCIDTKIAFIIEENHTYNHILYVMNFTKNVLVVVNDNNKFDRVQWKDENTFYCAEGSSYRNVYKYTNQNGKWSTGEFIEKFQNYNDFKYEKRVYYHFVINGDDIKHIPTKSHSAMTQNEQHKISFKDNIVTYTHNDKPYTVSRSNTSVDDCVAISNSMFAYTYGNIVNVYSIIPNVSANTSQPSVEKLRF